MDFERVDIEEIMRPLIDPTNEELVSGLDVIRNAIDSAYNELDRVNDEIEKMRGDYDSLKATKIDDFFNKATDDLSGVEEEKEVEKEEEKEEESKSDEDITIDELFEEEENNG